MRRVELPVRVHYVFQSALRGLLALLSAPECAACGQECGSPRVFCSSCGEPQPIANAELCGLPLVSAGAFAAPLRDAIHRFKFEGCYHLAAPLSRCILTRLEGLGHQRGDYWVPVPLHPWRLIERGYNQSALLAAELARATGGRSAWWALSRQRATPHQTQLDRAEREANVRGAFIASPRLRARRVVLVDDVSTTGATLEACCGALKQAGAHVVFAVTVARVL